jgi:hypothetical protein
MYLSAVVNFIAKGNQTVKMAFAKPKLILRKGLE